jgi:DNA-binding GntR family transcriptional regulator
VSRGPSQRSRRLEAYQAVRRRIIGLDLAPGAALSENELAEQFGLSRTPVREALILLADEGLVQVFPKIGSFVARVDPGRVADAQFLREAVEMAGLESLTQSELDPEQVEALRQNLAAQEAPGLDLETFFGLDEEFHRLLLALSGHAGSWPAVATAKGHLDRARMLALRSDRPLQVYVREHRGIFEAALTGRAELAQDRLRSHLRTVFSDIEDIRRERPELFASDPDAVPTRKTVAVWG